MYFQFYFLCFRVDLYPKYIYFVLWNYHYIRINYYILEISSRVLLFKANYINRIQCTSLFNFKNPKSANTFVFV